ncbi:MAG: AsmA family protein [Desulfovibrio sp.]|jgi:AsmA protein|nr:AsmA family protein [Desulfovibrio sp.]
MRFLVIIGGAVAGVFVLAAVLLTLMVDPNKYKDDIARLVREQTGRELVFEGDVKLTFFPRLGVETGGVRLSNPPGFGDKPFSRVRKASVSIKLLPLFSRRVEVGKVALDGLELYLEKDVQGRGSWSDFTDETPADNATHKSKESAWGLGDLSLDGIRVTDSLIQWQDDLLGERYTLSGLDLEVKAIRPGRPCEFKAAFLLDSAKPQLKARTEISGTATLYAADERHIFNDLKLAVAAEGKDVPGGKGDFEIALSELKVDHAKNTAQGVGLAFSAYGAKGTGQFQATNIDDGPDVKGRIDVPDFNGRELSAALTGKAPDTADAGAYQHITASLEFKAGKGYTEIPQFTANLDDARVEGRFRVTGLEKKAYNFNVRISGLDADRFLPAKKAGDALDGAQEAASGEHKGELKGDPKDELFPVKKLREMKLDGQITAERFKIKGLRFTTLKLPMMAQDGVLDVGLVEARLYDGTLKGSLRVDVQGDRPVTTLTCQLVNVQQKPLFSDMAGKESQYSGVMSIDTVSPLVSQGNSMFALKRSTNGRVRFSVRDGVFPGVNMLGVVSDAGKKGKEALTGAGTQPTSEKSTRFGSIDGTAAITNGVASINDLDFKAPFLRGEGRGTVDIATKQTDYTLHIRVVPSTEGQGGSAGLLGLVVPLRITGPYDNLSFSTDYLRTLGKGALDAVGGVVQGIGNVLTGGKRSSTGQGGTQQKGSGGLLDGVKKLF